MPVENEENGGEVSDTLSDNENECDDRDVLMRDADDDKMAEHATSSDHNGEAKKKYDPKDPLRPRRKKARRACYACQRAHLTCGDERPCQRCIKRGLANACQDGVRKKAKYLHDAPAEALRPVLGPNYNTNPTQARPNGHKTHTASSDTTSIAGSSFASSLSNTSYGLYSGAQTPVAGIPEVSFGPGPATSPVSPSFPPGPRGSLGGTMSMVPEPINLSAMFDPSNPALFNFDLEHLNFGSNYPALEFNILGHMSSGAASEASTEQLSRAPATESPLAGMFGNNPPFGAGAFEGVGMSDFPGMDPGNGISLQGVLQHGLPHAYAIAVGNGNAGTNTTNLASPSTENTASPQPHLFDGSPTTAGYASPSTPHASPPRAKDQKLSKGGHHSTLRKRKRSKDPSLIYETVKEPYPYLVAFHNLFAFLKSRYPTSKVVKIAKSLSVVRPAFMACTQTLNRADLIFAEKSFQRTLFEYEDIMSNVCAPTIVCRRTGEVAAVNRAFTALTGWREAVLLGKELNHNVNTGGSLTEPVPMPNPQQRQSWMATTPKLKTADLDSIKTTNETRNQPIFIPELLDDDSVVQFYEDFVELAFENRRGRVMSKCRLLKYQTQQDRDRASSPASTRVPSSSASTSSPLKDARGSGVLSNAVTKIDSEHGISKIEKDGKVDCTYCWEIKRDTFNIPMLIIMNFLPCYYRNQEPHRLAL